ncbi:hypothetical protein FGG08_004671 [Glutinoglossum americanum]|uniref:purine-nucleoside phosphorylase n=1 Tax=Glutinoglossum americanum TaxID=1670608 RepID=A0A9P8I8N6_9PEZI|nr:hypothetical protein FGG08_004671 [Glutinoglossum americanum]
MEEVAPLNIFQQATETAQHLQRSLPLPLRNPRVGIICGSGLGGLADAIHPKPRHEVAYADIPHFPKPAGMSIGVTNCDRYWSSPEEEAHYSHYSPRSCRQTGVWPVGGETDSSGLDGGASTVSRIFESPSARYGLNKFPCGSFYEGHTIEKITFPIRVLKSDLLLLVVTNAAGGLNASYAIGDVVVMHDHLNLAGLVGVHPLRGPNADDFGIRFPALSDAYDLELRRVVHRAWKSLQLSQNGRRIHEGVYAFVGGPSYETRAECRLLHSLGADLVGMSTVPEIIVARHSGLRVLALSLVTNIAVLDAGPRGDNVEIENVIGRDLNKAIEKGKASHEEVLAAGLEAAKDIQVSSASSATQCFTDER